MKKSSPSLLPKLIILGVVGAIGGGYLWMNSDTLLPKNNETKIEIPQITQEQWKLENDLHSVTWEYPTSGDRTGKVGFSVKLEKDEITKADVTILTTNEESKEYQTDFKNELTKAVVGKKISELVDIDVIGGASSTTDKFSEAVIALSAQLNI